MESCGFYGSYFGFAFYADNGYLGDTCLLSSIGFSVDLYALFAGYVCTLCSSFFFYY